MLYLWIKALHIIFMVMWFAGLFYLPRLFVYHADADDAPSDARFKIMERKLFAIMTIGGVGAVAFGLWLVMLNPAWMTGQGWLHAKLVLVLGLIIFHGACAIWVRNFAQNRNKHSGTFYRWLNEVPAIALIAIAILVVVKPF